MLYQSYEKSSTLVQHLVCVRENRLGFRLTAASLTSAGHLTRFSKAFVLQTYVFLLCSIFAQTSLAQIYTIKKRLTFVRRFTKPCDSVGIRTQDPQLRRLLLYPAELPNQPLFGFRVQN